MTLYASLLSSCTVGESTANISCISAMLRSELASDSGTLNFVLEMMPLQASAGRQFMLELPGLSGAWEDPGMLSFLPKIKPRPFGFYTEICLKVYLFIQPLKR